VLKEEFKEELNKLPQKSGVYIMRDKSDVIIYIGKAKNLRNRVRQYFHNSSSKEVKTKAMVSNISTFEYIVTDTEVEALILENNLIKTNKPRYNILLKDDKTYPYIKISLNENYPRVLKVRNLKNDNAKYYGPYTSKFVIKETLDLVHKLWAIRTCKKVFPRDLNKDRTCLNYHIGKCKGVCNKFTSEEDYKKMINEIMYFLDGKHDSLVEIFTAQMSELSKNLEFEKAAVVRDKIILVKSLTEKQKIDTKDFGERDVIAFATENDSALVQVFFVRGGRMIGREHFMLNGVENMSQNEIMTAFVQQFYSEITFIPKEIILKVDILDKEVIAKWLASIRGYGVNIIVPQKGEKFKLANLASENAEIALKQFGEQIKREKERTYGALLEIEEALNLNFKLDRIEAYDISNTQGYEAVASMVVFEGGKAKRSDYRKFRIKEVLGANDYASMEEVINRRFKRYIEEEEQFTSGSNINFKFRRLPDLIFVDGGKGQISVAKKVLKKLKINIPICGIVKDDKHRTRGLIYNGKEIILLKKSEGFKLITRIQDEAHHFAIEYHKTLRGKKAVKSILDDIKGIGPTRRTALIKKFGSIDKIADASVEELLKTESINKASAKIIYNFFANKKD